MLKTAILSLSLILLCPFAHANLACPKIIELDHPRFIAGQNYPSFEQLQTNFNQSFQLPGRPNETTWDEADLQAAHALVTTLKRHTVNDQVLLTSSEVNQTCTGRLETIPFTVDELGIRFDLNFRDSTAIQIGEHSAVTFSIALPSNCSNCANAAELFECSNVTIR